MSYYKVNNIIILILNVLIKNKKTSIIKGNEKLTMNQKTMIEDILKQIN